MAASLNTLPQLQQASASEVMTLLHNLIFPFDGSKQLLPDDLAIEFLGATSEMHSYPSFRMIRPGQKLDPLSDFTPTPLGVFIDKLHMALRNQTKVLWDRASDLPESLHSERTHFDLLELTEATVQAARRYFTHKNPERCLRHFHETLQKLERDVAKATLSPENPVAIHIQQMLVFLRPFPEGATLENVTEAIITCSNFREDATETLFASLRTLERFSFPYPVIGPEGQKESLSLSLPNVQVTNHNGAHFCLAEFMWALSEAGISLNARPSNVLSGITGNSSNDQKNLIICQETLKALAAHLLPSGWTLDEEALQLAGTKTTIARFCTGEVRTQFQDLLTHIEAMPEPSTRLEMLQRGARNLLLLTDPKAEKQMGGQQDVPEMAHIKCHEQEQSREGKCPHHG